MSKSIALKIAAIIKDVQVVEKTQFNKFLKYHYSSKDDIFSALRAAMSARNLSYLPSITHVEREPVGTKGETRFMISVEICLVCGDTGESAIQHWQAEAHTKDNLGIQQAMTQAIRSWAVNTFMLMDESHEDHAAYHEVKKEKVYQDPLAEIKKSLTDAEFVRIEIDDFLRFIATKSKKAKIEEVSKATLSKWVPKICDITKDELKEKVNLAIKTNTENKGKES